MGKKNKQQNDMELLLNGLERLIKEYKTSKQKASDACYDRNNTNEDGRRNNNNNTTTKTTASRWYRIDNDDTNSRNGSSYHKEQNATGMDRKNNNNTIQFRWYKISNNTSDEAENKNRTRCFPETKKSRQFVRIANHIGSDGTELIVH